MKKKSLKNNFLYKIRLPFAFLLLAVAAILIATFRFANWPAGISESEINSAIQSHNFFANVSLFSASLIDAPWHFFQWLSLEIFGFSLFSLRLPALIFSLLAAAILIYLAKLYFGKKTAFFAGFFLITNVGFLSMARGGSEISLSILVFAIVLLLIRKILAIDLSKSSKNSEKKLLFLLILFAISISSLFYFSGGIYLAAAIFLATVFSPTSRAQFLHNKNFAIIFNVLILLLISPILVAIFSAFFRGDFSIFAKIFLLSDLSILENLRQLAASFFAWDFSIVGGIILPIFSIVEIILAIFGLIHVLRNFHTPRDFLLISLLVFAGAMSLLDAKFLVIFLLPVFILIAQAFSRMLLRWSDLFPLNPYPRFLALGLLATVVLISCWINYQSYFLSVNYNKSVVYEFDNEFTAAEREISAAQKQPNSPEKISLIVPENRRDFYEIFAKKIKNIEVISAKDFSGENLNLAKNNSSNSENENSEKNNSENKEEIQEKNRFIVFDSAKITPREIPRKIVTDWHSQDSVLLKIY